MMKIHFTGIKGSGVSSLAQVYKTKGHHVTGSDVSDTFFTDSLLEQVGLQAAPFDPANVEGVDFVCASAAYNETHPEIRRAKQLGIPVYSYPELLGKLTREHESILITGTHGKTTTTGLVGTLLMQANLDPTIVVGSYIESLGSNNRSGQSSLLVVEACEYKRHFLEYEGRVMVVTNVDFDHPDYFKDLEDVYHAFQQLASTLPADGVLIVCGDNLAATLESTCRKITYGLESGNDIVGVKLEPGVIEVYAFGERLGIVKTQLMGDHNIENVLAVVSVGLIYGVPFDSIQQSVAGYCGVKRRLEYKGELNHHLLYDDYAHHPTEIRVTLSAVKEHFPQSEVISIFQPHTYSRTKNLLCDFAQAFESADRVVLTDIYASEREKEQLIDIDDLVVETRKHHPRVDYVPKSDLTRWLQDEFLTGERQIFLTMGAGDIYKEGEKVLQQSRVLP
ncbi:MAG: UDP-N-acetylmuramate--L-alanine ligase [Bacilli bacterium]|nr:UDP-N-acetylmuramate--L-alanine ligase [Bacilli bacterium]